MLEQHNLEDIIFGEEVLQNVTERPLPPELISLFKGKTESDLLLEECMDEFIQCAKHFRESPVCAKHSEDGTKKLFVSLCEMMYENCKTDKNYWHYIDDSLC